MTSSMAVYEPTLSLSEENFNPYEYAIAYGDRNDFNYGEGKRLAEAVVFQQATFPVVAARFQLLLEKTIIRKGYNFTLNIL